MSLQKRIKGESGAQQPQHTSTRGSQALSLIKGIRTKNDFDTGEKQLYTIRSDPMCKANAIQNTNALVSISWKLYKSNQKAKKAHGMSKTGRVNSLATVWRFHQFCFLFWTLVHMFHTFHMVHTFTNQDGQGRQRSHTQATSFRRYVNSKTQHVPVRYAFAKKLEKLKRTRYNNVSFKH